MKISPPGVSGPRREPDAAGGRAGGFGSAGVADVGLALSPVGVSCGLAAGLPGSPPNASVVSRQRNTSIAKKRALDRIWPPQSGVSRTLSWVSIRHSARIILPTEGLPSNLQNIVTSNTQAG